ncbi:MAG: dUTP diphosphatase [Tissierella sp.]|nr:dUTP diphosphatase [Tissierella sp.]
MARPKVLNVVGNPEDLQRQHITDAGYDLRVKTEVEVVPGKVVVAPTGVKVAIPEKCVGVIAVRSSIGKRGICLANGVGIIDSGYRGEMKLLLTSLTGPQTLFAGERVAQLLILPLQPVAVKFVEELEDSDRGERGIGSTGVK